MHEVHLIVRNALDLAVRRQLLDRNVALAAYSRPSTVRRHDAGEGLDRRGARHPAPPARPHRLYPAIHLAAHTGMRRGEVVGLQLA